MSGSAPVLAACLLLSGTLGASEPAPPPAVRSRLDALTGLEVVGGKGEVVTYRGRRAVHLVPAVDGSRGDESVIAILGGLEFRDGTIEVEVAGAPRAGAPADSRGFVGVEFRLSGRGARGEIVYLRPTNARADDQVRRNHSVQYESVPDFPWHRLRKEAPAAYESYADLEAGAWTKMRIVVAGSAARLFVDGASQPCLVVNDLKLGPASGAVALWAHVSTDAYFSNLTVTPSQSTPSQGEK